MRNSFLDFLLESRSDSDDSLQALRGSVHRMREPIGTLARRQGLLNDEGISRILEQQQHDARPFGELAARMGLLAVPQIQALLQLQRLCEAVRVAELLASSGHLTLDEAVEQLDQFFLDAGLQDRMAYLDRALQAAEHRASELSGRLAGLNGIERDVDALFREVEQRRAEVREAKRHAGELERVVRSAAQERERAVEERDRFRDRFEAREEDLLAVRRAAEEAKKKAASERKRMEELEARFAEERHRAGSKLDEAVLAQKSTEREAEAAGQRALAAERARDALREELAQAQRDLAERDLQVRALEGELTAERESTPDNGSSGKDDPRVAELERRIVRREAVAENTRQNLETTRQELRDARRALEAERAARSRTEEALADNRKALSREQRARTEVEGKLDVARKVERATQQYADRLERSMASARKVERSTQRYADRLERELAISRKVERSTQRYADRLEKEIEELRARPKGRVTPRRQQ